MSMMFHTRWPLAAITVSLLASVIGAAHVSEVLMTQATLLGGLDSPCEPNATVVCEPSVVDAVAWVRELKRAGAPHAFLPTLDRSHILPKLHPLDWGANFRLHTKLGHTRAFVSFLGFPIVPTVSQFAPREQDPHVLDNYKMPIEHNMRNVLMSNIIDEETALHFVSARIRFDPLDDLAKTAATTMEWSDLFAKKEGRYRNTMVVLESDPAEFAAAIHKHGQFPEIICQLYARQDSVELKDGTWLLHVKTTKSHLHRIAIHRASNTSSEIVNVTLTAQPLELPPAMRTDPQYVADRAMMKAEALIAAANNPVQGSTAGPMPPSTLADGAAICRRGECAMGNLWADAIRNLTGTDIAFFSGSWVKGPGWPAGNVLLRDIFASYAFIETAGKVTVLGLSLFELWNHSLGAAAFDPYLPTANAASRPLPQVSGMRVRYNLARTGADGKYNRVVAIDVWDRALNEYRPLERLKKYTVSGPGYLMRASAVHSKYLKGRYKGEIPITPIERNVQDLFRDFLARTNGQYTPGIFGRMIEDNSTAASMRDWNHALVGCSTNFVMDTSINTCVPCPVGTARAPGASQCTAVVSNKLPTTTLIAILAGICVFVLLICLVLILVVLRWRRYKRTQYCPKDPRQPIAAFFVTVRNEVALRERYPATAHVAFKRIEDAVTRAATSHHCFVARRLGAHFLVVSAAPANAVRAIAEVYRVMDAMTWNRVLEADSPEELRPTYVDNLRRSVMKTPQTPGPQNVPRSVSGGSLSSRANSQRTSSAHSGRHSARSRHYQQSPQSDHCITQPPDRAPKPPVLCPVVSAGVAFGTAIITYDDELDTWVYAGPVVDAAASVADAARPRQFLATSAVVDAVDVLPDVGASFEEFVNRRMLCPLTLDTVAVALHQLNPHGCQHQHFEPVSSDSDTAGALTAALEVAASGITSRTIGVVCWSIPALRSPRSFESRADQARQLEAVLAALLEVSRECHASLTSATDGTFVAIVNGVTARTAQVTTTTAALARAGVVAVQCSTDLSIVASVVTGSALTGALMDTVVVSGTVVERSRLISTIAAGFLKSSNVTSSSLNGSGIASAGLSVFITCDAFTELDPHYVLAAVDAFMWPDSCTPYPQAAGGKSSQTPVSLYAVMEEKGVADDEWLYQLAEANKCNPYSEGNAALRNALRGKGVDSSSAQGFARLEPVEHLPAVPLDPATADSCRRSTVGGFPAGALSLSELRALIFELEVAAAHGGVMPEESAADCVQRRILDVLRTRTQRIVSRFTM